MFQDFILFHQRHVQTQFRSKVDTVVCEAIKGNGQLHKCEELSSLGSKQEEPLCTIKKVKVFDPSDNDSVASNKDEAEFSSISTGGVDTEEDVHQHDEVGTSYGTDGQNAMKSKGDQSEETTLGYLH